jgi:cohesin complex subunit SA-1/2
LLEQEYQFMATVSTFLRAIRAGAVHVKHSDVLLANHGRLGPAFDLCTKVIIDVLREEGMYNDNGEIVVEVIKKALLEVCGRLHGDTTSSNGLPQSFSLVMDSVVKDEERTVNLAKQLASSFIIRGAQLAVVRKLDGKYIAKAHKDLLKETIKNISACEKSKNKKRLHTAVLFFKVLVPLLSAVESRDALAMYVDHAVV